MQITWCLLKTKVIQCKLEEGICQSCEPASTCCIDSYSDVISCSPGRFAGDATLSSALLGACPQAKAIKFTPDLSARYAPHRDKPSCHFVPANTKNYWSATLKCDSESSFLVLFGVLEVWDF